MREGGCLVKSSGDVILAASNEEPSIAKIRLVKSPPHWKKRYDKKTKAVNRSRIMIYMPADVQGKDHKHTMDLTEFWVLCRQMLKFNWSVTPQATLFLWPLRELVHVNQSRGKQPGLVIGRSGSLSDPNPVASGNPNSRPVTCSMAWQSWERTVFYVCKISIDFSQLCCFVSVIPGWRTPQLREGGGM